MSPSPGREGGQNAKRRGRWYTVLFFVVFCCVFVVWCRRGLTLPQPPGCSTISVCRLSFRVRNGTGRFPAAIDHRQTFRTSTLFLGVWVLCQILHSGRGHDSDCFLFLLFFASTHSVCWCLLWSISTSSLHTLQCVQVWPIYPIVFRGP